MGIVLGDSDTAPTILAYSACQGADKGGAPHVGYFRWVAEQTWRQATRAKRCRYP